MSLTIKKIPVFVFPNNLKFYLDTKSSHKQLLTLYNPYEFPVRFKVYSTAPKKYVVIDPEGSIGPQMLVDIVIRHIMPTPTNCNVTDKFRIVMQDHSTQQVLGKREIDATLIQGERDSGSNEGEFQSLHVNMDQRSVTSDETRILDNRAQPQMYKLSLCVALFCCLILCLPTQAETPEPSNLPEYVHVSYKFKLVVSYLLGLVCMVIFKQ